MMEAGVVLVDNIIMMLKMVLLIAFDVSIIVTLAKTGFHVLHVVLIEMTLLLYVLVILVTIMI
jgi:hypothetical protein